MESSYKWWDILGLFIHVDFPTFISMKYTDALLYLSTCAFVKTLKLLNAKQKCYIYAVE